MPDKLLITAKADGEPTAALLIRLRLLADKNNPFDFVFGARLARDQIPCEAGKTIDLFPMDHRNIEVHWNRVVRVTPMNLSVDRLFAVMFTAK